MSVNRLAAAGVLVAAAVAVPVAALAAGPSPSAPPPVKTSSTTLPDPRLAAPIDLSALASSAGISVGRLNAGLVAAKQAGGNSTAAVAAFAASAGVSSPTAQKIVSIVFGSRVDRSLTGQSAAAALGTQLGITTTAAQSALAQLRSLGREGGLDPTSPAFASIARGLGVSPTRLATALPAVKQTMAGR
jgi:hypothetical protein